MAPTFLGPSAPVGKKKKKKNISGALPLKSKAQENIDNMIARYEKVAGVDADNWYDQNQRKKKKKTSTSTESSSKAVQSPGDCLPIHRTKTKAKRRYVMIKGGRKYLE